MPFPPTLPSSSRASTYPTSVPAADHDQLTSAVSDTITELSALEAMTGRPGIHNLATGFETHPVRWGNVVAGDLAALTSGTARFAMWWAPISMAATQIRMFTGGTAAGTVTTAVMAVHSVDSSGNLTRLAVTTNDTALFNAGQAAFAKTLSATVNFVAGQFYATEVFVVATTPPTLKGLSYFAAPSSSGALIAGYAPRICAQGPTSQANSLTSYATGTLSNYGGAPYAHFLP